MAQAKKKSRKTPPKAPVEKLQDEMVRDVDETLRQEKLQGLWNKYGSAVISAAVIIVLATGVSSAFKSYEQSKNEKATTALIEILDSGNSEKDLDAYISENKGTHQVVASFELAGKYRQDGEIEKASAIYKQISDNKKVGKIYQDFGTLLYAATTTDESQKQKLETLFKDDKSPWRAHAGFEWALYTASLGDHEKALKILEEVKGFEITSIGIRQKSEALITLYKLKGENS